jgi:hypothetical protein
MPDKVLTNGTVQEKIIPLDRGSNGGSEHGPTQLQMVLGRGQMGRGEIGSD